MMIKKIIKFIILFFAANALVLVHFLWRTHFSNYLNLINVIIIFFVWIIIVNPRQKNYWWIIYMLLLADLFYSTPFGLQSISQITALLLVNWLLLNIFTNRSLFIVVLNGLLVIVTYRLLYLILLSVYYSTNNKGTIDILSSLKIFGTEAIVNALVLGFIYLVSSVFVKRLHPEYVTIK